MLKTPPVVIGLTLAFFFVSASTAFQPVFHAIHEVSAVLG